MYKVLIVGAGPVGVALAANLSFIGIKVSLLSRVGFVQNEKKYTQFGKDWSYPLQNNQLGSWDLCFVCTKAYDLESAFLSHIDHLKMIDRIILFTNGYTIALAEKLTRLLRPEQTIEFGVTDMGVSLEDGIYTSKSRKGLFSWSSARELPVEKYILSSNKFKIESNPSKIMFSKWVKNVVINSLAAAHNFRENGLINTKSREFNECYEEAYTLAVMLFGEEICSKSDLYNEILDLIEATSKNFNSMAYDRLQGRKTESSFLAGLANEYDGFPTLKNLHRKICRLP